MEVSAAATSCSAVIDEITSAVVGDRERIETILTALIADGHVLLEDVPGTGKTLLARSIAESLGLAFTRIQFTPDLLPADITGTHVFDESDGSFTYRKGPIFANVVLADEINRAPPKTQAALLEAMSERQVSAGGETMTLPDPFFVIATQNPIEHEGTFPLPEAQIDRFTVTTDLGYPQRAEELTLLARRDRRDTRRPSVSAVVDAETVREIQGVAETVTVDPAIREYVVDVCRATRSDDRVEVGVSPRGVERLFEVSRGRAVLSGRGFVTPEDVRAMIHPVLDHRIVLTTEAEVRSINPRAVVTDAVGGIPVPSMPES